MARKVSQQQSSFDLFAFASPEECVLDEVIVDEAPTVDQAEELPLAPVFEAAERPLAATAISQRLAPGGDGGGAWLGGPRTDSLDKWSKAKPDDVAVYGIDLFGDPVRPKSRGAMSDRFTFPPFSVLDARQGAWQERKRFWLALGIESELGRGGASGSNQNPADLTTDNEITQRERESPASRTNTSSTPSRQAGRQAGKAAPGGSARPACNYSQRQRGDGRGRPITDG